MLQKRITLPTKKIILPKSKLSKVESLKNISKSERGQKISNSKKNIKTNDSHFNEKKDTNLTTETSTSTETMKKIYIYHKNLSKQKNTLNHKTSKRNITHETSHDNIKKKNSNYYNTIEFSDSNEKYETINNIYKLNTNRNTNTNTKINNCFLEHNKNTMLYSDKNILDLGNNRILNNNNKNFQNFDELDKKVKNIIKKKEIINIEDLLLLEEKFYDVYMAINSNTNVANECFEFINFYNQSSLFNKFENYFKDFQTKSIVHFSLILMIFDLMLIYHISFDIIFFNNFSNLLSTIIKMNHQSYLLICNYISNKVSSSEKENIWVKKLRFMLNNNINHLDVKTNRDFENFIQSKNLKNSDLSIPLIEIKYYIYSIQNIIIIILQYMSNNDDLKSNLIDIYNNLSMISIQDLNFFFAQKIFKILNENASIVGMPGAPPCMGGGTPTQFSKIKVPFITTKLLKKFSLVLDLDETLISFKLCPEKNNGLLRLRPGLLEFLDEMKKKYELIIFTSATNDYAEPLLNGIEKNKKIFDHKLFRQHTIVYNNEIVKDISKIGRPLDKMIIVDNLVQNFRLQKENGIMIKPFWGEDCYDRALFELKDILNKIADEFDDVRMGIKKYKDDILCKVSSSFSKNNKYKI